MPDPHAPLECRRLLAIWAPLAATFLLLTGATPVINAAINRLPGRDHAAELAAFALLSSCLIVIHSPLFVTREIAIKLAVDRRGTRRAMRFCVRAAIVVSSFEVLLGATPVGDWLLGAFTERSDIVRAARPAFLLVCPVPLMIAVRGVYQAHQIRADDTIGVGLGTLLRLILTAVLGLVVAPRVGLSGPMLGALCVLVGIVVETLFAVVRARRWKPPDTAGELDIDDGLGALRFGLPLMAASLLGVATALVFLRIAARVPGDLQRISLAAFQEVKSLHWMVGAGAFALQPLVTAKARGTADARPLLRFSFAVGVGLSAALSVLAFVPSVRQLVLVRLLGEPAAGPVLAMVRPALLLTVALPLVGSVRFALRGLLIARGRSRPITACNALVLLALLSSLWLAPGPSPTNGALNAYVVWNVSVCCETLLLGLLVRRMVREDG